ncbi:MULTISPECIES: dTDP-4-dehydrorhamnose reductase [unclassified Desulfurobacterium]|uniref:dTDP-4-dehydrorhamnose reductase n=1 Tax=Desulfurobacterium sp. TC5-1 TaxID=1158318 RepID=UPI0003B3DA93|nr:dTDP-4-dehydrorhamnose reductase [Desulfurobacterium sp. TC5-1]
MILITGKNGQLAGEFIRKLTEKGTDFKALSHKELDIGNLDSVVKAVRELKPEVIINCAAYNLVDKAEEEYEIAYKTNAIGPENLAIAAKEAGSFLIHYSTDYVFDGKKEDGLYTESDEPSPVNEYGKTKLEGEKRVMEIGNDYLIFRVSWVYGKGKQNFIYKLTRWAEKMPFLKIVCDEFSVPTSTRTIVDVTLKAVEERLTGLYHLVNSGYTSRFEWARLTFKLLKLDKFIRPVTSDAFKLPAKRPGFSPMSNKKLSKTLNVEIPPWEEALERFIKEGGLTL